MNGRCMNHMQDLPCEMCTPTKCLTHKQPLPCKTCLGQDVIVDAVVKDATVEERLNDLAKAVVALSDNLEEAIVTLAGAIGGKADQSQVSSLQAQVDALSNEVKMLRNL